MATILIIEDDEVLARMYATRLESEGHAVVTTRDGLQGIAKAKEIRPDVVLLDLMLPGITGQQVLAELRKPDGLTATPIIVLSNLANPSEETEAIAKGATRYLVKTRVTPSQVLETIVNLLVPAHS
ncbi:response regulator [Candidatus Curtissbacteria bacterium]|nr:response regulator [Candidatus Curtissbacteria bacterium]